MCECVCSDIKDSTISDSLSVAIPVVYARPFNSGVRVRVSEIPKICYDSDQKKLHAEVLAVRSKHVAHSINDLEGQQIRVWLNPVERGKKINHVNAEHLFALSWFTREQYRMLSVMISKAFEWIEGELEKEEAKMKAIVEAQFDLDDLYSRPPRHLAPPSSSSIHRGRKRG